MYNHLRFYCGKAFSKSKNPLLSSKFKNNVHIEATLSLEILEFKEHLVNMSSMFIKL